jgi:hypothetical protein
MSLRENIQIFHPLDIERYLQILKTEYGAREHPQQDGAYLIDGLPFYAPQQAEDHVFVLGFNMVPLSHLVIQALADHPELISDDVLVRWTQEQDVIFEGQPANRIGS